MKKFSLLYAASLIFGAHAFAIILMEDVDPPANKVAPTGALANSGWQFQGDWGGFLGTPIAPHFFISAAHIGNAGNNSFSFQNSTYTIVRSFAQSGSDLLIWEVSGTFGSFAPLYPKNNESGSHLVVMGKSPQRGSEISLNGTPRGWNWSNTNAVQRWGENDVAEIIPYSGHDLLYATFDKDTGTITHPHEAHLASGDSGGALFIAYNGVWKLAGINFSVDDLYTAPSSSTSFTAAIYDARDYYTADSSDPSGFRQITGPSPVPTGFYSSRISSELPWIYSVIDPTGDLDGDSVPNLLEYALHLDPTKPDAAGLPRVGREGNFLTLTYTKVTTATDINYVVEQSSDLTSWGTATTQDEVVSTAGNIQTIKAKIDIGTSTKLFARLRVARP